MLNGESRPRNARVNRPKIGGSHSRNAPLPALADSFLIPTKKNPGVYIRRNGDDDNGNMLPDWHPDETSVAGEDDLIQVNLDTSVGQTGIRYVLDKGLGIKIWTSSTKGTEVLAMQTTGQLFFPNGAPATAWVEWVAGVGITQAILTLRMQDAVSGNEAARDSLVFHPFNSIIVVFGGDGQVPTGSPPPDNLGIFKTAIDLYNEGYDVHMYNEDQVSTTNGRGVPYDEVVSAIQDRGVTDVAAFGFSQGGGAVFDFATALNLLILSGMGFNIDFTAYVDAIKHDGATAETRRPPACVWHLNIFERNTTLIHGESMPGGPPNGADEDIDADASFTPGIGHTDMDDDLQVRARVKTRLEQHLPNR